MPSRGHLAYLIPEYPAISHTFILREVRQLRALNWDIQVASINPCTRAIPELTHEEREELHTTFYVKPVGISGAACAHWRVLLRHPIDYIRGLLYAVALAAGDPRRTVKNVFYFVEAVIIADWMRSERLHHLHVHFASSVATVGLLVSRVRPIGFSLTVHGPDEFYNTSGYYLVKKIEQATFVCCISHFARSQLMRLVPSAEWEKLKLAPLGIDPTVFKPGAFRPSTGSFEMLCVGRLVPTKGQHLLIAALSHLRANGQQARP